MSEDAEPTMNQNQPDQNIPIEPSTSQVKAGGLQFDSRIECPECHCQLSSAAQLFLHQQIHKATIGDPVGLNKLPFALVPAVAEVLYAWLARSYENEERIPFHVDESLPTKLMISTTDAQWKEMRKARDGVLFWNPDCGALWDLPARGVTQDTGQPREQ